MRRLALIVLVLAAAGCGGSAGPSRWTVSGCGDANPPCESGDLIGSSPAPADTRAAILVAALDPTLVQLVGPGLTPTHPQRWNEIGGKRLGVSLVYPLLQPKPVHQVLPYVAIPPDAPAHGDCVKPYAPGWLQVDADAVDRLQVLVDLRKKKVVEIRPDPTSGSVTYSWAPGKPHPRCEETTNG